MAKRKNGESGDMDAAELGAGTAAFEKAYHAADGRVSEGGNAAKTTASTEPKAGQADKGWRQERMEKPRQAIAPKMQVSSLPTAAIISRIQNGQFPDRWAMADMVRTAGEPSASLWTPLRLPH